MLEVQFHAEKCQIHQSSVTTTTLLESVNVYKYKYQVQRFSMQIYPTIIHKLKKWLNMTSYTCNVLLPLSRLFC